MRRSKWQQWVVGLGVVAVACLAFRSALAAEIKVLSGGAVKAAVTELAEAFSRDTGHTVTFTFATTGAAMQKLAAGERTDVMILTEEAIESLAGKGMVVPGTRTDVARVGIGVAVREGAARPDISNPEAFKRALLAARSVAYMDPARGGTSGIHFVKVLEQLGIAAEVRPKSVLVASGYAAETIVRGEAEIVIHQISEILPVKGVTLIGPLPRELQKITIYSAGLAAAAAFPEAARAFIAFLARPAAKDTFAAVGMDYRE